MTGPWRTRARHDWPNRLCPSTRFSEHFWCAHVKRVSWVTGPRRVHALAPFLGFATVSHQREACWPRIGAAASVVRCQRSITRGPANAEPDEPALARHPASGDYYLKTLLEWVHGKAEADPRHCLTVGTADSTAKSFSSGSNTSRGDPEKQPWHELDAWRLSPDDAHALADGDWWISSAQTRRRCEKQNASHASRSRDRAWRPPERSPDDRAPIGSDESHVRLAVLVSAAPMVSDRVARELRAGTPLLLGEPGVEIAQFVRRCGVADLQSVLATDRYHHPKSRPVACRGGHEGCHTRQSSLPSAIRLARENPTQSR